MKVLILDNNIDRESWGSPELRRVARLLPEASFHTRRPPQRDLPRDPRAFGRIIVSGSRTSATEDAPWIDELLAFMRQAVDAGVPLLGVCYGHQSLARALGGKETVRRGDTPEFGWTKIEVTGQSPLFAGLPAEFHSYSSHYDEVCRLPAGFVSFARSARCGVQACQVEGKPAFGIQFHPEKSLEEGERSLAKRKPSTKPGELLGWGKGKQLYDAAVGERIFGNFLRGEYLE